MSAVLHCGDVRAVLATLPERSAQTVVTSPPYWGLRDYGQAGQLGLERTPEEYVASMVDVFRGVRRVLRDDGTLWLNLGDSYASGTIGRNDDATLPRPKGGHLVGSASPGKQGTRPRPDGMKPKDLVGIPWRVAFALQADGWYLRSDIIWAKPNPMPESVTDRPTKSHEYLFLLTKQPTYYYDSAAIAEPAETNLPVVHKGRSRDRHEYDGDLASRSKDAWGSLGYSPGGTRNARTVWTIATQPFAGAHFATFPEELARRCILAGSRPDNVVLDCFGGSGTTASVAVGHGRRAIHIDLNPAYLELARQRIGPMLCVDAVPEAA